MAVIDLIKWNPGTTEPWKTWDPRKTAPLDPGAKQLYACRYPETNLSTYTQLIVAESQEALLFSKGRMVGKFGPGKHTLNTENLPVLRNLFGIPFGGNNPFSAEVWFVNKAMPLNIDWETDNMRFHDPDYKTMVPLMARGRYGLKVTDAERFLFKLVGTAPEFSAEMLTNHFKGALVSKTKSTLLQAMQAQQIGVKSIGAYLDPLSQALHASMLTFWEEYGFSLLALYITSIDIDDRTPDGQQILKAMAQQSAQSIAGYTWQQNQGFEVAKDALSSKSDMGILGVLLMTGGMMAGGNKVGSAMMEPQTPSANINPGAAGQFGTAPPSARDVFCSNCSKKFQNTAKFCPHCGDPYSPCPRCGADNDHKATRCVVCGQQLPASQATVATNVCSRCQSALAPTALFCPACGMKVS
jgi:membrane protease subunit (stomatin/prohibitin family)